MFGVPFPPLRERMDRLECGARVLRALSAGQPVTLEQPYYPLRKAESHPLPPHGRLRLVVGGRGEKRTLRIVAEFADEWNATRIDVAGFRAKRAVLAEHCAAFSRDPETIGRSLMIPVAIGRDAAEVARRIAAARASFPRLPPDEAAWRAAGFLAGRPESVTPRSRWGRPACSACSCRCWTRRTSRRSRGSRAASCQASKLVDRGRYRSSVRPSSAHSNWLSPWWASMSGLMCVSTIRRVAMRSAFAAIVA